MKNRMEDNSYVSAQQIISNIISILSCHPYHLPHIFPYIERPAWLISVLETVEGRHFEVLDK
jgi:hypothetical protein